MTNTALASRATPILYGLVCLLLLGDAWHLLGGIRPIAGAPIPMLGVDRAVVVAAIAAVLALGIAGGEEISRSRAFAIGALCGLLFFARTLGFALADPTSTGWLMKADWAQHYSGWVMFRHSAWHWPPGSMPELWYPIGTSIVYTDSLPLLALLLKPFSGWLSEPFQYIGLWLAVNCILQGGFAALLVAKFERRASVVLAGAALFVFAPVFIDRIGHDTLTTQWLLLAAMGLYFRAPGRAGPLREAWPWWLLTGVAALVHPYLTVMTLAIHAAWIWKRVHIDRDWRVKRGFAIVAASTSIAVIAWWLAGALILTVHDTSGGLRYGSYSLNLLAFVNPMGFSRMLPTLPRLPGQYEGFAYLGAGMIALGIVATIALVRRRPATATVRDWSPLMIVAAILLVFAASTVLAIGGWTLLDAPIKNPLLGAFRSSGRFVWVAYYAIVLTAIVAIVRRFRPTTAMVLLTAALALQIFDFSRAHARYAGLRAKADQSVAGTHLEDARWGLLAQDKRHLTMLPPSSCGGDDLPYLPFLLLAARHEMTLNSGYLARWNQRKTFRYCADLSEQIASGQLPSDALYVVGDEWRGIFRRAEPDARCESLDGYEACTVAARTGDP